MNKNASSYQLTGLYSFGFIPDLSDINSMESHKKKMAQIEKELGQDDYNAITDENISEYLRKSLQDYPVKVIWRW